MDCFLLRCATCVTTTMTAAPANKFCSEYCISVHAAGMPQAITHQKASSVLPTCNEPAPAMQTQRAP